MRKQDILDVAAAMELDGWRFEEAIRRPREGNVFDVHFLCEGLL